MKVNGKDVFVDKIDKEAANQNIYAEIASITTRGVITVKFSQ